MARIAAKDLKALYEEAKRIRAPYESNWRMAAAYCSPRQLSGWNIAGPLTSPESAMAKRMAYDNTGVRSLPKFAAVLNRIATPENQIWSRVKTDDYLMKSHSVRAFFDELNRKMWKMRYDPKAGFSQAVNESYLSIGLYAMGPLSLTWQKPSPLRRKGGYKYRGQPVKDIFLLWSDEGDVTHVFRRQWYNARQAASKFGKDKLPDDINIELSKPVPDESRFFEIVWALYEQTDYDPDRIDHRRHPVCGNYLYVGGGHSYVGDEEGFTSHPLLTPRIGTESGDSYGFSVAGMALPALGGLSAQKKTVLRAGHRAVDPTLLAGDDGVMSGRIDIRPGHIIYNAVDSQGRPLIRTLESGNPVIAEKLMQDEREDIQDSFLVTLFKMFDESPQMTATEVVERLADRAAMVAPIMSRLQGELLGPLIEREIALLAEHGLFPEMPPELIEAEGEYEIMYTSAMARSANGEAVKGFLQWHDILEKRAQAEQNPDILDWADMDAAAPEIAEAMAVPTRWVSDPEKVQKRRADRQQQTEQQQMLQQAPAIASVVNGALKRDGTSNAKGVPN